jgi:hypothetical protein
MVATGAKKWQNCVGCWRQGGWSVVADNIRIIFGLSWQVEGEDCAKKRLFLADWQYWRHILAILAAYFGNIGGIFWQYWRHMAAYFGNIGGIWRHILAILAAYFGHCERSELPLP